MKSITIIRFALLGAIIFLTPESKAQTVTDIDGNTYASIKIGKQEWLAENLNVSQFRNGDPIPQAVSDEEWEKAGKNGKPAWCYYEYNAEHGKVYGKLYNWYAVNDKRGLAPKGWHIPSDEEWIVLRDFLGGEKKAGGKLKKKGTTHWKSPNTDATNSSGFSGLPGGLSYNFGSAVSMGNTGYWWTTTVENEFTARLHSLDYKLNNLASLFLNNGVGASVRCIKD